MFISKERIAGCIITVVLAILIGLTAYATAQQAQTQTTTDAPTPCCQGEVDTDTQAKRALFVVFNRFSEEEYDAARSVLEDKGVVVTVASASLEALTGLSDTKLLPDIALSNAHGADYDAIVFLGAFDYDSNNADTHRIAQEADAKGNILAAICAAPITLSKAGVLKGKKATSFLEPFWLEQGGAIYTVAPVVRDGNIVTASSYKHSRQFAETIAAVLEE